MDQVEGSVGAPSNEIEPMGEGSGEARPCTEGGTRTLTPFRTADFESAASAIPPLRLMRCALLACGPGRACTTELPAAAHVPSRRVIDEDCDWSLSRAPMPSSLRSRLNELAASFSAGVLDAIRGASLEELLSESSGGKTRRSVARRRFAARRRSQRVKAPVRSAGAGAGGPRSQGAAGVSRAARPATSPRRSIRSSGSSRRAPPACAPRRSARSSISRPRSCRAP